MVLPIMVVSETRPMVARIRVGSWLVCAALAPLTLLLSRCWPRLGGLRDEGVGGGENNGVGGWLVVVGGEDGGWFITIFRERERGIVEEREREDYNELLGGWCCQSGLAGN